MAYYAGLTSAVVGLTWLLGALTTPAHASHDPAHPSPHATIKIWDTGAPDAPSLGLGLTPGESVEDPLGLTGHGTAAPTIANVYARGSHPGGPSGVAYWNPDGNVFVWYGKTIGFPGGVDINRAGPAQSIMSVVCGEITYGPGALVVGGQQGEPLYVHFAGTDCFRTFGTGSSLEPSANRVWGVKVDDRTGEVFFSQPVEGTIGRSNSVTGQYVRWVMGGGPAGITVDDAGRPYTTLSHADGVLRIDSGNDGILGTVDDLETFWQVPNLGGVRSFRNVPPLIAAEEYPNAVITIDADGMIWFTQSNSHEIGRLSEGPDGVLGSADDIICEYTAPDLANPQQIASTGAGSLLQIFFTEGEGDSASVLTPAEADASGTPICTPVPAQSSPARVSGATSAFFDEEVPPQRTAILPTVHDVPGMGGSGFVRFSPMPNPVISTDGTPIGDAGNGFPSGMTGVYAANRIAGAYLKGNKHFELESPAMTAPASSGGTTSGRMTGGGWIFTADGSRVTYGFVLSCQTAGEGENVFQVDWEDGQSFSLERVDSAACDDDSTIAPQPPDTGFDTHSGWGVGSHNGIDGAAVEWMLTDAGEPGADDAASILIRDSLGAIILDVGSRLEKGNHQAHQGP